MSEVVSGIDDVWRTNSGRLLKWELTEQSSSRLLNSLTNSHVCSNYLFFALCVWLSTLTFRVSGLRCLRLSWECYWEQQVARYSLRAAMMPRLMLRLPGVAGVPRSSIVIRHVQIEPIICSRNITRRCMRSISTSQTSTSTVPPKKRHNRTILGASIALVRKS